MPLQTQKHLCVMDRPLTRRSECVCLCVCVCVCVGPTIEHSTKHSALRVRNVLLFYYIFYCIILLYKKILLLLLYVACVCVCSVNWMQFKKKYLQVKQYDIWIYFAWKCTTLIQMHFYLLFVQNIVFLMKPICIQVVIKHEDRIT